MISGIISHVRDIYHLYLRFFLKHMLCNALKPTDTGAMALLFCPISADAVI